MIRSRQLMAAAVAALLGTPLTASPVRQSASDQTRRIQDSIAVLDTLTRGSDDRIPEALLQRAEGIVVIPSLIKGGFILGAKHGTGIVSARDRTARTWSPPAFVRMTGGSIGWQIGVESIDLVLLVMNPDGIDKLLQDKFTIGANLSVSAGPLGRSGDAAVNTQVNAPILAYSRSKGLFAGATFEGAALHADDSGNKAFYGTAIGLRDLIRRTPDKSLPPEAMTWTDTLSRLTTATDAAAPRTR